MRHNDGEGRMMRPRLLYIAIGLMAVAVAVLAVLYGIVLVKIAQQARVNTQSTKALCVLRYDLQRRTASSQAFLRMHPHGIPGIPARTIKVGIVNQQRTISALKHLHCPPDLTI